MDAITFLQAHCTNQHYRFRLFFDIVVDPQISYAEFPWRHRIGTHRLPMTRFDRRLMRKLFIYRIQNRGLLTSRQIAQVFLSRR